MLNKLFKGTNFFEYGSIFLKLIHSLLNSSIDNLVWMKNNSLEKNSRLSLPVGIEEEIAEDTGIEGIEALEADTEETEETDKEISITEEMMALKAVLIAIKLGILPGNAQNVRFLLF